MNHLRSVYSNVNSVIHKHTRQRGLYIIGVINVLILVFLGSIISHTFAIFESSPRLIIISAGLIWFTACLLMYSVSKRYGSTSLTVQHKSIIVIGLSSLLLISLPSVVLDILIAHSQQRAIIFSFVYISSILGVVSLLLLNFESI